MRQRPDKYALTVQELGFQSQILSESVQSHARNAGVVSPVAIAIALYSLGQEGIVYSVVSILMFVVGILGMHSLGIARKTKVGIKSATAIFDTSSIDNDFKTFNNIIGSRESAIEDSSLTLIRLKHLWIAEASILIGGFLMVLVWGMIV